MPFSSENPTPGPGKPRGAKSTSTKLIELLGLETINNALIEDFKANKGIVRQFVYDHTFGKPINKNENINENSNFDRIEITLIKHSDITNNKDIVPQLPQVSQNQIEVKPDIKAQVNHSAQSIEAIRDILDNG
jgi:hypothetical protein